MAKAEKAAAEQPTELPVTFTYQNDLHGIDAQNQIWRRKHTNVEWTLSGKLPVVTDEDRY